MRWEKSSNGPDWIDIRALIGAMEQLHEMQLTILLTRDGMYDGPGLRAVVLAVPNNPMEGVTQGQLSVSGVWPNSASSTMTAHIFNLLMMIDRQVLVEWWDQKRLA